ncbi:hypothetical protein V6245_01255 [Salinibacterium amurskyense]|uniref:hypothetical protein n=1 Tax=Salinibacterium amurskyense TaxID=205941 RepID=UPI003120439B
MTTPPNAMARDALDFQAQQLRMILERLTYVRSLLPEDSIDWRGPAQQLFDAGVGGLHRDLACVRRLIEAAENRTVMAASQMGSYVG